jgi:NAD(P)-dependent dehydrogenase (short-subunit alcohol dehydrogenase family)
MTSIDEMPDTQRLKGKVAVVTGAASGIGLVIARLFARNGATVLLSDVNEAALLRELPSLGEGAHAQIVLDVASENSWAAAFDFAQLRFGRVDIVVNNAGIPAQTSIEDTSLEAWRRVTSINLDGTFLGCKYAIQYMKRSGGSIVNVSSIGALKASTIGPAYGAAKAGVWNLTKTVALYCARTGYDIRCNSLHPGLTHTPMMDQAPPATIARLQASIPVQRLGEPLDMAYAALYLASDESRYVTGTSLVVDGGYSL